MMNIVQLNDFNECLKKKYLVEMVNILSIPLELLFDTPYPTSVLCNTVQKNQKQTSASKMTIK